MAWHEARTLYIQEDISAYRGKRIPFIICCSQVPYPSNPLNPILHEHHQKPTTHTRANMAGYGNRTAPDYTAEDLQDQHSTTRLGLVDSSTAYHNPHEKHGSGITGGAGFGISLPLSYPFQHPPPNFLFTLSPIILAP
jgi:hypothetical protein